MFVYRNTITGAEVTVPCKVKGNWELVREIGKAKSEKPKVETQEETEAPKEEKKPIKKKK